MYTEIEVSTTAVLHITYHHTHPFFHSKLLLEERVPPRNLFTGVNTGGNTINNPDYFMLKITLIN